MPWLETAPMDQRERFIADARAGLYSMTELCERYGISRKTGYKWRERVEEGGRAALADRSRAPHHCPHPSRTPSRSCSAPRGATTRSGVPSNCSTCSAHGIAGSRRGLR